MSILCVLNTCFLFSQTKKVSNEGFHGWFPRQLIYYDNYITMWKICQNFHRSAFTHQSPSPTALEIPHLTHQITRYLITKIFSHDSRELLLQNQITFDVSKIWKQNKQLVFQYFLCIFAFTLIWILRANIPFNRFSILTAGINFTLSFLKVWKFYKLSHINSKTVKLFSDFYQARGVCELQGFPGHNEPGVTIPFFIF